MAVEVRWDVGLGMGLEEIDSEEHHWHDHCHCIRSVLLCCVDSPHAFFACVYLCL